MFFFNFSKLDFKSFNSLRSVVENHVVCYPTPLLLSNWWSFGLLVGACLVVQILTGLWLALYYTPDEFWAFSGLQYFMREVNFGWLLRYMHMNGASFCFILLYIHIAKGLYLKSFFTKPNTWRSGILLLLLFMASAFLGYTLTWSQMGYWAAVVITNILTSLSYIGQDICIWLWGNFAVANFALKRFFVLHFLIPFVLLALVTLHLAYLHGAGSSNPLHVLSASYIDFRLYFYLKDLFLLSSFLFIFYYFVFINPYELNHADAFVASNPLVTPHKIVPEWYFLPYYTMLRSFPSKAFGVFVLGFSIIVFLFIFYAAFLCFNEVFEYLQTSSPGFLVSHQQFFPFFSFKHFSFIGSSYNFLYLTFFWAFAAVFFILEWIGTKPANIPFIWVGIVASFCYFALLFFTDSLNFLSKLVFFFYCLCALVAYALEDVLFELKKIFEPLFSRFFAASRLNGFLAGILLFSPIEPGDLLEDNDSLVSEILMVLLPDLLLLISLLVSVAFFTLVERKVLAKVQRREGPSIVGFWGLIQPLVDGLKLFLKEVIRPKRSNFWLFWFGPIFSVSLSLSSWALSFLGWQSPVSDANLGLMFLFALASLNTYSIIIASWSSNSRYSLLGCLRSVAQLISYELVFGFSILYVAFLSNSFNITDIVVSQKNVWFIWPLFPVACITYIMILAETSRIPFDLPESESELVAGYHTEYSAFLFACFLVAEYSNILLMSWVWSIMFLGGWWAPFSFFNFILSAEIILLVKVVLVSFSIILVRAAFPRVRFDFLLSFSWGSLIPFLLTYTFLLFGFCVFFDCMPVSFYFLSESNNSFTF